MTTIENIRSVIQKVLDTQRDFTSENAKAEASALNWVLELFDKYAEQEPCDDVWEHISKLSEIRSKYSCFEDDEESYYRALSEGIKALKAISAEPKTGHWINDEDTIGCYYCSECGGYVASYDDAYCKYCGCRMVEPQESEDKE